MKDEIKKKTVENETESKKGAKKHEKKGAKENDKKIQRKPKSVLNYLGLFFFLASVTLLIVAVSIFFIIYASGGRRNEEGEIVVTGSILIDSEPQDIKAFVDNQPVTLEDQKIIGLEEGEHNLKVTAEDYLPWEKDVFVTKGLVERVYVKLFPKDTNLEQFTKTNVEKIFFSEDGDYMYYAVADADKGEDIGIWRQRIADVGVLDIFNNNDKLKITNFTADIKPSIKAGKFEIIPSLDDRKIILKITGGDDLQHYVLNADSYNEPGAGNSLEEDLHFPIDEAKWLDRSSSILLRSKKMIAEYNPDTQASTLIDYVPDNDSSLIYSISGNRVYLYDAKDSKKSIKYYEAGKLSTVKLENIDLTTPITTMKAAGDEKNILYYKSANGNWYYLNILKSYQYKIRQALEIQQVSRDGGSVILVESSDSITAKKYWVLNTKEVISQNKFDHKLRQLRNNLLEVKVSPKSNTLLMMTKSNELYVADIDGQNAKLLVDQETQVIDSSYQINSTDSNLFVLISEKVENQEQSQVNNNIYRIDLKVD